MEHTEKATPGEVRSSDQLGLVERLRAVTPDQGWAVVNTKTEGIVIWFSKLRDFNARQQAYAFLAEHKHYGSHEVREYTSPCLQHEAADELERLRAALMLITHFTSATPSLSESGCGRLLAQIEHEAEKALGPNVGGEAHAHEQD